MTLALGFVCRDGVVLAADSELSNSFARSDGDKIWYLRFPLGAGNPTLKVGVAGAGHVAFLTYAKDLIQARLLPTMGLDQAQAAIGEVLKELYREHIYSYGQPNERDHLNVYFLVGIAAHDGRRLLATELTAVNRVTRYQAIGGGTDLADFVVKRSSVAQPSVSDAVVLASQVLRYADDHVLGVGGPTRIIVLYDTAHDAGFVGQDDIAKHEAFVAKFDEAIRPVLLGGSDPTVNDDVFLARLDRFRQQMLELKGARANLGPVTLVATGTLGVRGHQPTVQITGPSLPLAVSSPSPSPSPAPDDDETTDG